MFGLKATAVLGIACAALTVMLLSAGAVIWNQWGTIDAKDDRIAEISAEKEAQAEGLAAAQRSLKSLGERVDSMDIEARKTATHQQELASDLAGQLQTAQDTANLYLQQLEEKVDARPIVVSAAVPDGWDPYVLAGMRRLRCVQLTAAGNPDAADCRVSDSLSGGGPGAAGDPAGAPYPRPSAKQQLAFLSFAWSLREWGASCYRDKAAISASQEPP